MADEAINRHKRLAMGMSDSTATAKGKSVIQKYKSGGSAMKKGGAAKKMSGFAVTIAIPVKKSAGRGR